MFKNVAGRRFAEITASSGTGNLQKGHGVSCADWDRDGDVDLFIEMGGAVNGDKYHNILFQNPGQGNHWLTVKLVGKKTNRAAIGARIKVVTAGDKPMTVHRHVSSGSSWGANPLEQHIGLAKAEQGRAARGPLAGQRDDPGVPRHRRGPGHRGHRIRDELPQTRLEADPGTEMSDERRIRWGILGCARIARRGLVAGHPGVGDGVTARPCQPRPSPRDGLGRRESGSQGLRFLP